MAKTDIKNPKYHSGPQPQAANRLATDSKQWVASTPAVIAAAGTWEPAVTGSTTGIAGFFAEDQTTNTSTSTVKVFLIDSSKTKFIGYVSNDDADTTATTTDIGGLFGLHVSTTFFATVNTNDSSGPLVIVDELLHNIEDGDASSADNPGRVIFRYQQIVLDGE